MPKILLTEITFPLPIFDSTLYSLKHQVYNFETLVNFLSKTVEMMIVCSAILCVVATSLILILMISKANGKKLKNKKTLIIGGSSGLGLAMARKLYSYGNEVTITSRSKDKAQELVKAFPQSSISKIEGIALDSTTLDGKSTNITASSYDFIFYCAGVAYPGYFKNQTVDQFIKHMDLNFIGMIRSLYHYRRTNKKPFVFVYVASTAGLFRFPGYSSYSPSKTALTSFYKAARLELLMEGIELKVLYPAALDTPGFQKVEQTMPNFTKDVELTVEMTSPEKFAEYALGKLLYRDSISLDWFTYFLLIRDECEKPLDYLLFPVSVIVACVSRIYAKWYFLQTRK